jgi:hypothetical protein
MNSALQLGCHISFVIYASNMPKMAPGEKKQTKIKNKEQKNRKEKRRQKTKQIK